jgi:uncharacterized protein YdhG (YjbR/CyaY superfamily)
MGRKESGTRAPQRSGPAFTPEERAAMRERAREAKTVADRAEGERAVLAKIAEMEGSDRIMAERIHAIVKATAPGLSPRTWYGMPAYAKDDQVVCFFRCASKFKTRYATLGFSDEANLDSGRMWATDFALTGLTAAEEARITELVRKAVD